MHRGRADPEVALHVGFGYASLWDTEQFSGAQQMQQGAINQFYPGAQFSGLALQAYKNGQYGNAIGYGIGAVADSLLALVVANFSEPGLLRALMP